VPKCIYLRCLKLNYNTLTKLNYSQVCAQVHLPPQMSVAKQKVNIKTHTHTRSLTNTHTHTHTQRTQRTHAQTHTRTRTRTHIIDDIQERLPQLPQETSASRIMTRLPGARAFSSFPLLFVAWLHTTSSGFVIPKKWISFERFSPHCMARRPYSPDFSL
jgi:hypothetical protein